MIDPSLLEPDALLLRHRMIEESEFDLHQSLDADNTRAIKALIANLKAMNDVVCNYWREQITTHGLRGQPLREGLNRYTHYLPHSDEHPHFDYEDLDILIKGMFEVGAAPDIYAPSNPDMVHMERSPVSAVLDMVDHVNWQPDDVFIDLGSGFGAVPILVYLLTDVNSQGIELDSNFHVYAQQCTKSLRLDGVTFINNDVRKVDLSEGTVFYLFTPFSGDILRTVLNKLHAVAVLHPITIATFGPCTPWIAQVPWLERHNNPDEHTFKLTVFHSQLG